MGAEKSVPQGFAAPKTGFYDEYIPMGGTRIGNDNLNNSTIKPMTNCTAVHNAKLLKTQAPAVWTIVLPIGQTPCSRTSHWSVFEPTKKRLYIGYGINSEGATLNDVWAFDFRLQRWAQIPIHGEKIEPRSGTKAALLAHYIVLFGGYTGKQYVADFHIINLDTFEVSIPSTKGVMPSPRTAPLIATYGQRVLVWGGFNGDYPSELCVLDTSNLQWSTYNKDVLGRTAFAWIQEGSDIFIFGGSQNKNAGYLQIDCTNGDIKTLPSYGLEANTRLMNSSIVDCGPFYVLIGGKSENQFSFILGFQKARKSWFLFNVVPDNETVTVADGEVTETGLFKLPRNVSISLVYYESERTIYGFLGLPHASPPPVIKLAVDNTISFINLQNDMLDIFKSQI